MNRLDGLTKHRLCSELGLSQKQLNDFALTAPERYTPREFDEGDKTRQLLVPDPPLRALQRSFYRTYLRDFPYHEAVYCQPDAGVVKAAKKHRKHSHLLHLDLANFFPSVSPARVADAFTRVGVSDGLTATLTRLLTVDGELPQGAPTSVAVGNLVLFRLDVRLQGLCEKYGLEYTRYVDDLAISGGKRLRGHEATIRKIIADCGWGVNDKGGMLGPDDEHQLLGLQVGVSLNVDEAFLNQLQSSLRALRDSPETLGGSDLDRLQGRIGWVKEVEPERGAKLERVFERLCTESNGEVAA